MPGRGSESPSGTEKRSAVDARGTRHEVYWIGQQTRQRIERLPMGHSQTWAAMEMALSAAG